MDVNDQPPPPDDGDVADWVLDQVADHLDAPEVPDDHSDPDVPDPGGAVDDELGPDLELVGLTDPTPDPEPPDGPDRAEDLDPRAPEPDAELGEDVAGEIDLPVDDAPDDAPDDAAPTDTAAEYAVAEGPLDLDPSGAPWPDPTDGVATLPTLEHAVDRLGGVDLDALVEVTERLGLADELDLGLDGRTTAVVLGELGLDALVDHGSLDDLAERLAAGDEVLVGGAHGQTLTVTHIDDAQVVVAPTAGGPAQPLPVAAFERAWEAAGYEMVVADPAAPTGDAITLAGGITVLPITLSLEQPSG